MINKFRNAFRGIKLLICDKSVLTQIILGIIVLIICLGFLKISNHDIIIILSCIGFVVVSEMINTCLEKICDLIDLEYNENIKNLKDMSAGFVLMSCIFSAVIGIIVLWKYIF